MRERYYTMVGDGLLGQTIEERVRKYHNRRPETWDIERAIAVASLHLFDTIVTVVE